MILTVPFRTLRPSVFFCRTTVKDHSGESLFSLLLDSLHTETDTHTQHKNTIALIVRSTAAQQRSNETSVGAPSRRLPVRVFRAAVAVPLLPVPPVPVNQLAEVGRLLAVLDDELVLEELLGCGTLCGEEDSI